MKITKKRILQDYNKVKTLALRAIDRGHWDKACKYMERAAVFMYNCNVIYSDAELDEGITIIADKCIHDVKNDTISVREDSHKPKERRVVFYDYFTMDNRGLTEQYIDAFTRLDYKVLFIVRNYESDDSREIFRKIRGNSSFSLYVLKERQGEKIIREFFETATHYYPTDLLAHTSPWDIEGLCACAALKGYCNRFLSNITDHAFWLGVKSFDFFLEFRDYGCNISLGYRGISPENDFKIPYFPIINKDIPFEGFTFDEENKKIVVSGGGIYKIKGSPKFLDIVKYILDKHKDVIFLYLGYGDHKYLQDFSDRNGYEGRFFHLNERKDIYQIIRHCTIYLNTYPLLGGLMTQIASMAGKLPLTLNDDNDPFQSVSEFLLLSKKTPKMEFQDMESLKQTIDAYLENPELLSQHESVAQDIVPNNEMFAKMMQEALGNHKTPLKPVLYQIDTERFSDGYIRRLNEDSMRYRKLLYSHNIFLASKFPSYFFKMLLYRVKHFL